MIKVKEGVQFSLLRHEIYSVLIKIEAIFKLHRAECIITCGTDRHGPDDPHTHGFALDFRSWHIASETEKEHMRDELKNALGGVYTVIYEPAVKDDQGKIIKGEHFHIQIRKDLWRSLI